MNIIRLPITLVECFLFAVRIAEQETYYPECKRKSRLIRIMDNIRWRFKYRENNKFYNLYGMDIKGVESLNSEYIDYRSFMKIRNQLILTGKFIYSQNAILRDKLLFFRYMKGIGIPTPTVFAVIFDGAILDLNFQPIDIENFKQRNNYFIKDIDGQDGSCVMRINDFEDYNKNVEMFLKGRFIVQESLIQHPDLERLNSHSVNTLRMVTTIDKSGEIRLIPGFLRVGTSKSGDLDNWAKGGLIIGFTEDGFLNKYGFNRPEYGTKESIHPDSKIEFETFRIPYFNQAVEAAIHAHKFFYGLHSIGWDIAVTENGYTFIEGNDNWEISAFQACHGGLKKEWLDSVKMYQGDNFLDFIVK